MSNKLEIKRIMTGLSIHPEVLKRARVLAASKGRSFSNIVEMLLRGALQTNEMEKI
jgi:hypothetical protein